MKKFELDNQYRVFLNPYEYETILDNTYNEIADLAIRLGGEVGLRVSEIQRIKPEHIETLNRPEGDVSFLYVPKFDSTPHVQERGRPRSVFLPSGVEKLVKNYVTENDIDPADNLISVTKRTIQDNVKRSAERTAENTGDEDFSYVSMSDFRAYFVRNMIENHRIHPRVVLKMGGWARFEPIEKHLREPDEDLIVEEYRKAGID